MQYILYWVCSLGKATGLESSTYSGEDKFLLIMTNGTPKSNTMPVVY